MSLSKALQRSMITIAAIVVVLATAIGAAALAVGADGILRGYIAIAFFVGGIASIYGLSQFVPEGPTIPAFLAFQLLKATIFTFIGIAFFLINLQPDGVSVDPVFTNIIAYGIFAGSGTAKLLSGFYMGYGAGRGWIDIDVNKPFLTGRGRGTEEKKE